MASVIFFFSFQKGFFSKILSLKVFVVLGEISFAFYLVHQLVIRVVVPFNQQFLQIDNAFFVSGLALITAGGLSYLLFKFFEKPLTRAIKKHFVYEKDNGVVHLIGPNRFRNSQVIESRTKKHE